MKAGSIRFGTDAKELESQRYRLSLSDLNDDLFDFYDGIDIHQRQSNLSQSTFDDSQLKTIITCLPTRFFHYYI